MTARSAGVASTPSTSRMTGRGGCRSSTSLRLLSLSKLLRFKRVFLLRPTIVIGVSARRRWRRRSGKRRWWTGSHSFSPFHRALGALSLVWSMFWHSGRHSFSPWGLRRTIISIYVLLLRPSLLLALPLGPRHTIIMIFILELWLSHFLALPWGNDASRFSLPGLMVHPHQAHLIVCIPSSVQARALPKCAHTQWCTLHMRSFFALRREFIKLCVRVERLIATRAFRDYLKKISNILASRRDPPPCLLLYPTYATISLSPEAVCHRATDIWW